MIYYFVIWTNSVLSRILAVYPEDRRTLAFEYAAAIKGEGSVTVQKAIWKWGTVPKFIQTEERAE
jgi:hypothetical protein